MGSEQGGGVPPSDAGLQFDKVEHAAPPAAPSCAACHRPLDEYFEIGGKMICAACARSVARGADSNAFFRALGLGVGAAVVGTIVWYGILAAWNMELGLVAIAVGLLVGWAVRRGSGGRGGWQFQALAMALTYASIAASSLPMMIKLAEGENFIFTGFADYFAIFLASLVRPFAEGSFMGWIIIGIALYEGWKMNRRVPMSGPFRLNAGGAPPAPGVA